MKKQIWIVDDDEEMNRALQLMIKLLGHESMLFTGARPAAKVLLEGQRPDLILLDINMPDVSGVDFLKFLRQRPENKHIPVVVLSTEAAEEMIDKVLEMGADAYVTKPVPMEELEQAMRKAFQAHGKQ